jgi:hypothetical protein
VFKSSEEANQYFKDAEGSTHNDWTHDRMEKNHKVFVKKFNKSLDDQISSWHHTAPPSPTGGGSKLATHRISASIGEGFSDWARGLGGRSPGEEGSEGTSGGAGRGGGPRRARGNVDVEAGPIEVANGRRINVWKIVVGHPGPGTVNVGLREADEEAAVMSPTASAPGGFPTLSELTADREIVLDGSDAPSKRFEFPVDPMEPNITDVMVRVTGSATTTIFVRGLFDEGTLPVLVASFDADGTTS